MPFLYAIVGLILVGVTLTLITMDTRIRNAIVAVAIVGAILYLCAAYGVFARL